MQHTLRRCGLGLLMVAAHAAAGAHLPPCDEHFESGWGLWTQSTNDLFDWTLHQGYTPSGYYTNQTTGPSAAFGGVGTYAYIETSYPRLAGDEAIFSAAFDLRVSPNPVVDFRYHRCGASQGPLYLEASTGGPWTVVWSVTGRQHAAETAPWARAQASLSGWAGLSNAVLRWRGVRGSSYTGDAALDDLRVRNLDPIAFQGFEGAASDTWHPAFVTPGQVVTQGLRVRSGGMGLALAGSWGGATNAYVEWPSVDVANYRQVVLVVPFAANGPDGGDDLHVMISTNGGASWSGNGYGAQVCDGSLDLDLPFDTLSEGRTPAYANPYLLDIPDDATQVAVRVQFFDANPSDNRNDAYYLDDVALLGAPIAHPISQALDNDQPGWFTTGPAAWAIQTNMTSDGVSALAATPAANDWALLQTLVDSPGTLSFRWRSTLAAGDSFSCFLGDRELVLASGPATNWNYTQVLVEQAENLVRWMVQRGADPGTGLEGVWLDQVQFSSAVTEYPYAERFESGFGLWSHAEGFDFRWVRTNGPTPSVGTGPSRAHEGASYVFTEVSGPTNGAQAALDVRLDLAAATGACWMSFAYHMYGAYAGEDMMGELFVDVLDSTWHTGVWHRDGSAQATNEAPWSRAVVDLAPYAGTSVLVRLRGMRATNAIAGWAGDMAVDQVSICPAQPLPLVESFSGPDWPAGWMTESVTDADYDAVVDLVQTGEHPVVTTTPGDHFVRFNSWTCDSGDRVRLVLPPISTLGVTQGVDVAFTWHEDSGYSSCTNEGVAVQWSTDGLAWQEAAFFQRYGPVTGWIERMGRLPAGANNRPGVFVALEFRSAYGNDGHLDDVALMVSTNSAPEDIALSGLTVAENAPTGTLVGVFNTLDEQGGAMTYHLVGGAGDTDNGLFRIDGDQLIFLGVGDVEAKRYYTLRVRVTDHGGLTFEKSFAIAVTDMDEAPVGQADTYSLSLGGSLNLSAPGVLGNDADPEGAPLQAVLLDAPDHGSAQLQANGALTYTNDGTARAYDTLQYAPVAGDLTGAAVTVTFQLLPAPASIYASQGSYADRIHVWWSAVPNAGGYAVYRSTEDGVGTAVGLLSTVSTSYDDYNVDQGRTYYYWVRPIASGQEGAFSAPAAGYRDAGGTRSCSVNNDGSVKHQGDSFSTDDTPYMGWVDHFWPWENDEEFRGYVFWDTDAIPGGMALESAELSYLGYEKVDYGDSDWVRPRAAQVERSRSSFFGLSSQSRFEYSDSLNAYGASYFYMDIGSDQGGSYYIYDVGVRRADIMELVDGHGFGLAFIADDRRGSLGTESTKLRARAGTMYVEAFGAPGPRYPAQGAALTAAGTVNLVWNRVLFSDNFYLETRVQVSSNSGFSAIAYDNTINAYGSSGTNGCHVGPLAGSPLGRTYYWRARSEDYQNEANHSDWSAVRTFRVFSAPAAPLDPDATDGLLNDGVQFAWAASAGAEAYLVYRNNVNDPGTAFYLGRTEGTCWEDRAAEEASNYFYWVVATNIAGASAWSATDSGYWGFASPNNVQASDGTSVDAIHVSWSPVVNALSYEIWRGLVPETNAMSLLTTTYETAMDDASVGHATNYHYRVVARRDLAASEVSLPDRGCRGLAAPVGLAASRDAYDSAVALSWSGIEGAYAYEVLRNTSSNLVGASVVATVTGTAWTNDPVTPGAAYFYAVRGVNPVTTGAVSALALGYSRIAAPTNIAATDGDYSDRVRVTWGAVPDATGYRVYRSRSNDVAGATILANVSGTALSDYSVSAGITYYYWVSARGTGAESGKLGPDAGYRGNTGTLYLPVADRGSIRCTGGDSFQTEGTPYIGWREDFWGDDDEWRAYVWWDASAIPSGHAIEHASIDYLGYSKVDYPDNDWTRPRGARMAVSRSAFFNAGGEQKFRDEDKLNVLRGSLGKVVDFTSSMGDYGFKYDIAIDRADLVALLDGSGYGIGFASDDTRNNLLGSDSSKCYIYAGNITVKNFGAPGLFEPQDGTQVPAYSTQTLRWNAVLDSSNWYLEYQVQVSTRSDFLTTIMDQTVQAFGVPTEQSTQLDIATGSGTQDGRPLYWRVRCKDYLLAENASDWSATWTLSVVNPPSQAPAWLTAGDDAHSDRVDVQWASVSGAQGYVLYRGTNTSLASASPLAALTNTAHVDLEPGMQRTNFYWVAATNVGGVGPFAGPEAGSRLNNSPVILTSDTVQVAMSEDGLPTAFALELEAADADGDTLVWSVETPAAHGQATAAETGAVAVVGYAPQTNYVGVDTFVVRVEDGQSGFDRVTVSVTVAPMADPPVAASDAGSTDEDHALTLSPLANDTDPDSGDTRALVSATHGTGGLVTTLGDALVYTPFTNWNGSDQFTYVVADSSGLRATGLVLVTVNPVNDAPVLTPYNPLRPAISWDDTDHPGVAVSTLLWISVADVDASALTGMAVTAFSGTNGAWQASTNAGADWFFAYPLGTTQALLLAGMDRVRFLPDGLSTGMPTLTWCAWDRSSGLRGQWADSTARGGSNAFSLAVDTLAWSVQSGNIRPVATIERPLDGSLYVHREVVVMRGSAEDAEDGSLTNLGWSSSLDGPLGYGAVLTATTVSVGSHVLTLNAIDTDGGTAQAAVVFIVEADSDTNGLPDIWESLHGPGPGTGFDLLDSDGDGMRNDAEWIAGTDPTNRESVLRVQTRPDAAPGIHALEWAAASGRFYAVYQAEALDQVFTPLAGNLAAPQDALLIYSNAVPTNATRRYYRIRAGRFRD